MHKIVQKCCINISTKNLLYLSSFQVDCNHALILLVQNFLHVIYHMPVCVWYVYDCIVFVLLGHWFIVWSPGGPGSVGKVISIEGWKGESGVSSQNHATRVRMCFVLPKA